MAFNRGLTKRKEQACEITVKMSWNFHFRTRKFANLVSSSTSHNLHCNFLKFCSIVTCQAFKP